MKVPFLDLNTSHTPLRGEINQAIQEVIESGAFAGGPFVARFEEDFAAYCQAPYAVGVGSGTEALWLTLLALGIGQGDEVITVPNTFMATAEAITYSGATPAFVDVDSSSYTMDPAALERAITPRTKAVIPVHLFGHPADMDPIVRIAREHGLFVIEDACQAHGAEYHNRRIGTLADAACFSFYPGKNLGAFGEAGAVVTDDFELQEKIRILRDHGQVRKYHHTMVGWNCRMDGMQAAVLRVKMRHLERKNQLRRCHAAYYESALSCVDGVARPVQSPSVRHVFHIYAVRVKARDRFIRIMADKGVACAIHYPVTIHLQDAYRYLRYPRGAFPIAEKCAEEFVSLPMFPELTPAQLEKVVDAVRETITELT